MALAKDLFDEGDRWTDERARQALPILLQRANAGRILTYGELDREIASNHSIEVMPRVDGYGGVLEKVGHILYQLAIDLDASIPPANILVVNAQTRLPGSGFDPFLRRFVNEQLHEKLTTNNQNAMLQRATEAVFNYTGWSEVAEQLGFDIAEHFLESAAIDLPSPPRMGGGESEAHKKLKNYVAQNPDLLLRFGKFEQGSTESVLDSGDKIDILFQAQDQTLAVEVKTATATLGELTRGIFQCVKYRAVLRAMHDVKSELSKVEVVLVTPQLMSAKHKAAADRLGVAILRVQEPAQ
ncbi:MAG: hypothetical protein KF753_09520 [Caldilineaceae bacterium]|nr:hypothetical protein [Caldilineaceae bacterium]